MTNRFLIQVSALCLLVAGCSDFATEPTRIPASFTMSPDSVLLTEGETTTFEFTVLDEAGEAYDGLPGWASPAWTFTEDSIVRVDPLGVGEALGPGRAEGTATLAGMSATAKILVNPAELRVQTGFVHINQSTQRRQGDVPLVARRDGLLRVLVRGDRPNFFTPLVRATFRRNNAVVHTVDMTMEEIGLPEPLELGDLDLTYDALIPGSVLQPGTGLVVEIDPGGTLPANSESTLRIPATGERALDVVDLPPFMVRLVPVDQSFNGRASRFTVDNAEEKVEETWDVFPIAELDVDVRATFTTDADLTTEEGWFQLIEDIAALRDSDGSTRYYYGGFQLPPGAYASGLGYVGFPTSIGTDASQGTLAHELGHNLSLPHAPCGGPAGPDPDYPYPDGLIGQYGYGLRYGSLVSPEDRYDLMTYCDPTWISDYNYENVLEWRELTEVGTLHANEAEMQDVLLIHAGALNGALRLSPAIPLRARPTPLDGAGRYTLTGLDAAGAPLFSVRFEPRPLDHGDAAHRTLAIPVQVAQPDRLATLRLEGPEGVVERTGAGARTAPTVAVEDAGGVVTVRWDAASYPLAVIRNSAGQIVAMPRSGEVTLRAEPGSLDVTLSDGVRGHAVERRQR